MLKVFLIIAILVLLSVALLSIRLLCGKKRFVNYHIDGSKAMASRGIFCAKKQDSDLRSHSGLRIKEHQ